MRKISLAFGVIASLLIMAGCSKDKGADVSELLKTIPSDASVVMVMDMQSILKEADCEVSNGELKPGKELSKALASSKNEELKTDLQNLQDAGIEWTVGAVFAEGYNSYFTGFLQDTGKFKKYVEEKFGENFESGEVGTCGNVAIAGERFWICLNSRNTIVTNDIRHFNSLSEKQSILSNENVAKMQTIDSDIAGWGDIKGVLNLAGLDFATRSVCIMALQTVYVDAVEMEWEIEIENDEINADLEVINSKGGIAKFNFPVEKIDENVVKGLNLNAQGFAAIAISEKMIEQIKEQTSKESFSLLGALVNMMAGCVNGTTAVAFSEDSLKGVITTTGHGATDLIDVLGQWDLNVEKAGKDLNISKGTVTGDLKSADAAESLKGAVMGAVIKASDLTQYKQLQTVAVKFVPEKGGLKVEIKAKANDSKKKFLLNLL